MSEIPLPSSTQFRSTHGALADWSAVDWDIYEHLVEAERADQLAKPAAVLAAAYSRHHTALLGYIETLLDRPASHAVEDLASEVWLHHAEHGAGLRGLSLAQLQMTARSLARQRGNDDAELVSDYPDTATSTADITVEHADLTADIHTQLVAVYYQVYGPALRDYLRARYADGSPDVLASWVWRYVLALGFPLPGGPFWPEGTTLPAPLLAAVYAALEPGHPAQDLAAYKADTAAEAAWSAEWADRLHTVLAQHRVVDHQQPTAAAAA